MDRDAEFLRFGELGARFFAGEHPGCFFADRAGDLSAIVFDHFAGGAPVESWKRSRENGGLTGEMVLDFAFEFCGKSKGDKGVDFRFKIRVAEKVINALSDAGADVRNVGELFEGCCFELFEGAEAAGENASLGATYKADSDAKEEVFKA